MKQTSSSSSPAQSSTNAKSPVKDSPNLDDLLARAKIISEEKGERFTALRAHVYELVCRSKGAVKAYELLERFSPEHGSPKPPTIYRALDFLSRLGLVHRVEALNAFIACDQSHIGHVAEFFVCESCESVEERHAHDHNACRPEGFVISKSIVEHYGKCQTCAA